MFVLHKQRQSVDSSKPENVCSARMDKLLSPRSFNYILKKNESKKLEKWRANVRARFYL